MGKAGTVNAPSHAQGGKDFIVTDTGQTINIEGKEIVVPQEAVLDSTEHIFSGTNREVLGQILSKYDLSVNDNVTSVKSGDVVICKVSATDKKTRRFTGTVRQILSAINATGGCNMISDAADMEIMESGGEISSMPSERFIIMGTASTSWYIMDTLYNRRIGSQAWSSKGKQMLSDYASEFNQYYISDNTFLNPDKKTFEKELITENTALATASNFIADVKTHVMN